MKAPCPADAFRREACGCPSETWKHPFRCPEHAAQDGRAVLPDGPGSPWSTRHKGPWYQDNCCPFCGRVNPYGLACQHIEVCDLCGVRSCNSHSQATYLLGVICPRNINPRTKVGRAFLKALNFNPAGEQHPAVKICQHASIKDLCSDCIRAAVRREGLGEVA